MTFTQILAMIQPFLVPIEALAKPVLLNAESTVQADLKALIESKVSSPDLQEFLLGLDGFLDSFVQLEINKLG